MKTIVLPFVQGESGGSVIEYGLLAALVGVGIIVTLSELRDALPGPCSAVSTELTTATN